VLISRHYRRLIYAARSPAIRRSQVVGQNSRPPSSVEQAAASDRRSANQRQRGGCRDQNPTPEWEFRRFWSVPSKSPLDNAPAIQYRPA
jgi:hypothetical protein